MKNHRDKNQKELEDTEGTFLPHKVMEKRLENAAATQVAYDVAEAEDHGPPISLTSVAPQPRDTSQTTPSTNASERTLTTDSPVMMVSPYRIKKDDCIPQVTFSKDLLIRMDHKKHHLAIDVLRPEAEAGVFPPQDLSPLCLYRDLRILKITGMMQSYQWYIWLVVWLNPQLTDLVLEMAGKAEPLEVKAIAEAQKYARCKPTMREVAQGKTKTEVLEKLHIVNLSLTNFIVHDAPFQWFSETQLQNVKLHKCQDAGFQLPILMERSFNITVTA